MAEDRHGKGFINSYTKAINQNILHSEGFVMSIQWEPRASHSVERGKEEKKELSNSGLGWAETNEESNITTFTFQMNK